MPPEPLPWDRKDLFRERKHGGHGGQRPEPIGTPARWRDSLSSSSSYGGRNSHHEFSPRWGFPSSEFRRPPGHGKQGGWHMYPEDSVHGYASTRSGDRFFDDDGFRPSGPRENGRYGRYYRENRTSFGQREWRGHSWDTSHQHSIASNAPGRMHVVKDQRSVGDSPTRASHAHSDPCDQVQSKDQADKASDANGSGTGQKVDKENLSGSLDWKPLKWSRSGSLTSRGSGFSHSSSSKSIGGESDGMKVDLPAKNSTPVQSPSEDAAACLPPAIPSEENYSRKKPRLGWGEGLAKYEKKKVDGPEENANKVGNVGSLCSAEPVHSLSSNFVDKSPRVTRFSDCSSPATPSSVACSSSPGLEEKTYGKIAVADGDANNFSVSSGPVLDNQIEGLNFILEKLELNSIANLSSLLNELLQAEDQYPIDSVFVRSSALNKLLLLKGDFSKELEVTETEIDSLENELKSLEQDSAGKSLCRKASLCTERLEFVPPRPPPVEVMSSRDIIAEDELPGDNVRVASAENKAQDIDSPGTATSKFVEPLSVQKPVSLDEQGNTCSRNIVGEPGQTLTENWKMHIDVEKHETSTGEGEDRMDIQDDCVATRTVHLDVFDKEENKICDSILAANKDTAARASEMLVKLLPSCDYNEEAMDDDREPCSEVDCRIKEKFLRKKQNIRFKERAISLKYRVFQHLWKEDLRLLSLRSHRTKPQKKFDPSSRIMQTGSQKHRSSIRSRFASPAGSLSLVPTTEVINFTEKLLSVGQAKIYRNTLRMPSMILDEKEKIMSRFVSSNGLVEDPCAVEKERPLINPWTAEEKETFLDKLAIFGKDFRKIASFLDHKTTADCIEFYYKNHKSECFAKTNKKLELRKQGKPVCANTYLVASGKKWSREVNAASLDILGAASVIAAQEDEAMESSKLPSGKSSSKKLKSSDGISEASSSFNAAEDERETAAADVLAGICGSMSSEAMSSCITSSVDPVEGNQDGKHQKAGSSARRPLTPEVTQNVDEDTYSDESCGEMDPVDWTDDEKSLFVQAFLSYGKDFSMISRCVRTKTRDQCKVFFSKARKCLGLDSVHPGTSCGGLPPSNDANGGGSDTEDACIVETDSIACSDKSASREDEDFNNRVNQDVSNPEAAVTELSTLEDCGPVSVEHKGADTEPEDLCANDHRGEALETTHHGGGLDVQESKLASCSDTSGHGVQPVALNDVFMVETQADVTPFEDSPVISCVDMDRKPASGITNQQSTADFESGPDSSGGSKDSRCKESESPVGNMCRESTTGDPVTDKGESSKLMNGFPLDLSIRPEPEMNGPSAQKARSEVKIQPFQNCFLRRCNRGSPRTPVTELPLLAKSEDQNGFAGSSCSSTTEKSCGNGDVKLFGKILSKPSTHVDGIDVRQDPPVVKFLANEKMNGNATSGKHDNNSLLGLEEVPIRSYGFWDGTKIQTGFSTLPDSALLLAKYPAAFANFSIPSSATEQQPSQAAAVDANEHGNVNAGACVFNSNGSVIDYPAIFRKHEEVQPFRVDMKQRQDAAFPEAQRNGGFETVSSLQQVKLNVVQGGGERLVGGPCNGNGITDPVAALKLHYARAQQYGGSGHTGNGVVREESWRGQGDVGR